MAGGLSVLGIEPQVGGSRRARPAAPSAPAEGVATRTALAARNEIAMNYANNEALRGWLVEGGVFEHWARPAFEFDEEHFGRAVEEVRRQHPYLAPHEAEARAAYRLLSRRDAQGAPVSRVSRWRRMAPAALRVLWALAVLCLLGVMAAKAEPPPKSSENVAQPNAVVEAALRSRVFAQFAGGPVLARLQVRNGSNVWTDVGSAAGDLSLPVTCISGCSAGGSFSDNSAFTSGTTAVSNVSGVFNDSITSLASGNAGAIRSTTDRMLFVNVGKVGGTAVPSGLVDSGNSAFKVNCVVGCSASAGFTDNSAFTAGATTETNSGGVFNDSLAAVTSGNAAAFRITGNRALHINIRSAGGTELATSSNPIRIDPTGTTTQPVSGTVTANIGTTNGLALDATVSGLQVGQGSTSAGQKGGLAMGAVTTSAPSYTTAQTSPLSLTTAGALRTDSSAVTQPVSGTVTTTPPANASTNITQWNSVALGSPSAYGTSPGAVNVPGVNAFITNTPTVTANAGTGTFTISGTVTANAGTNLNTSLLQLDATGAKLNNAQGSTTSGQTGPLVQGAVTTSAPSYTTAQTSPLSLNTSGGLRVDGSGVTQPVSGTVTTTPPANASTNVTQVGGMNVSTGTGAGGAGIPRVTVSNDSAVKVWDGTTVAGVISGSTALKSDMSSVAGTATATGTGASGAGVQRVTVSNDSNILATQSGTWTIQPGNTANTTPWLATINQAGNSATVNASGQLTVNCAAGCSASSAADTVGSTVALNALNATASVALAGDGGAGMLLAAGTLIGTIVPEVSSDGGTTWVASLFYDPATQATAASVVFGSANAATTKTILVAGGASHARVRVSAFTSGTANATLRATQNAGSLVVNQGNSPWTVTANAGTGTFNTQDAADGSTGAATPSKAGLAGGSDGANLRALSVSSTGVLNAQDAATGSTGAAPPSKAILQGELNSGNLAAHIGCDSSVAINTASSGDVQLVALVAAKTIYICGYNLMAAGTTNVQLEYGTGTACATGKTALTGPYNLAAQTGVSYGNGEGVVFKTASANALCVNNSAAVQISGVVTYTQF
jgi:hypothetical protein